MCGISKSSGFHSVFNRKYSSPSLSSSSLLRWLPTPKALHIKLLPPYPPLKSWVISSPWRIPQLGRRLQFWPFYRRSRPWSRKDSTVVQQWLHWYRHAPLLSPTGCPIQCQEHLVVMPWSRLTWWQQDPQMMRTWCVSAWWGSLPLTLQTTPPLQPCLDSAAYPSVSLSAQTQTAISTLFNFSLCLLFAFKNQMLFKDVTLNECSI